MTINEQNPVIITQEDYNLLKPYIDKMNGASNEMSLSHELHRAVIVKKEAFPMHAVRLNSKVTIMDEDSGKTKAFTIVMPEFADMRQQKVSVLTPMGTALIGFRQGEEVMWQVPAGLKRFRILEVINQA
ncbi:MAG: GreA/GreB family elongation factor [Candidatus Pseudobacter hemicellulosilyticus]|uniref:GreA/GreB family elongation factor n=1 Tax=Candidatus Pseudobacter hemicellulosilyticus TaxID=3121375 RepID=A0AAJ5WQ06_9BACT|nr:MAG: GreA/GreB family elongation factor [Pseudobacter sp.]